MENFVTEKWKSEVKEGKRFEFGKNWRSFLSTLTEDRIEIAESSLITMLGVNDLSGYTFLDAGCGSGLFSLCARRLGAKVTSFDYDHESVACTEYLREKFFPSTNNSDWTIFQGSVLDKDLVDKLGEFDIVYSWGVLHHTGKMYEALNNVSGLVKEGGKLFISIYNDQGKKSKRWLKVKKLYNASPAPVKFLMMGWYVIRFTAIGTIKEIILLRPFREWKEYKKNRGMSRLQNIRDWIGGLPFEVAKPEEVFEFYKSKGFALDKFVTVGGGIGCNEFVFRKL